MKIKLLFIILLIQFNFGHSQTWMNSLADAKKFASATNRFIILDFNAIWCKPCRMMEYEYWNNNTYKQTLNKFIIVPIDIDTDKLTAQQYGVQSIPNVKVIDNNGNVIHEVLGFQGAEHSDREFNGFPDNAENLYTLLNFKDKKKPTDEELLGLATAYQVLLQKSKGLAKIDFERLSNSTFNKCLKTTANSNYKEIAELGKNFNNILVENNRKTIKTLDISKISLENKSYAHYILAKAYYQEKNNSEAEKHINEIIKINSEEWVPAAQVLKKKYNQ